MNFNRSKRHTVKKLSLIIFIVVLFVFIFIALSTVIWNLTSTSFHSDFDLIGLDSTDKWRFRRYVADTEIYSENNFNKITTMTEIYNLKFLTKKVSFIECLPTATVPLDLRWRKAPSSCSNDTFLVWLIKSSLYRSSLRKWIRNSWAQEINITKNGEIKTFRRIFLIGSDDVNIYSKLNPIIEKEHQIYKDILQGTFLDTFASVTHKVISGIQFVKLYCQSVKLIVIADDDSMILPWNLIQQLPNDLCTDYYGGFFPVVSPPIRNKTDRWYVSYESYKCDWYPRYAFGSMFVLSYHTMNKIFNSVQNVVPLSMDDVFVGGLVSDYNIPITEYPGDKYAMCDHLVNPHNSKPVKNLIACHMSEFAHIQYLLWSEFCHSPTPNSETAELQVLYCDLFLRIHWRIN